ncbi:uncharacterized protein [Periplaneta americana]|uniref:uncharacterized protein isoform X5 n=1 Tax=Periplaneta americana TaxID=6978 RepID=UPI0037E95407
MEVIKIEREIDTLAFELSNNTDIEEEKLQEGNVFDVQVTGIKTECVDHSYEVKSKMTFDKTPVPIELCFVKSEVKEGNALDLHMTEIKTECMDHSYGLKSEMTFEESSLPIDFPIMKSEAENEACELNKVGPEVKMQVTAEENEVFTDGCDGSNQD